MSSILLLPSHSPCPHHFLSAPSPGPIRQYQLYAVEKWIVQRKPNTFLVVFTGIPDHAITLDAYVPDPAHDPVAAWNAAIALLRADGAKPKLTAHGTLMLTSLAHFRSDYTIVHIPSGNFPLVRDHLYANINLLRMGCSGRSALTLEDPSDSTKDRFLSSYHLPDSSAVPLPTSLEHLPLRSPEKTKDRPSFVPTVLELVKLLQASLAIFGFYSPPSFDGLLCDESVDGIKHWIAHVGGPCVGLEPSERIADPVFVSAILSLVLSTRNKLAHLGYSFILPRDPFLYPHAFSLALTAYVQSTAPHLPHSTSLQLIPPAPPPTTILSAAAAASAAAFAAPLPLLSPNAVLTRDLLDAISSTYDAKLKSESRKVRRVIKNKLAPSNTLDSDGPDPEHREHPRDPRRHTLSLSLSGGESPIPSSSQIVGPAGTNPGVGSGTGSGGQILSGIGTIASGLRIGGGAHGDTGMLMAPTLDLKAFVAFVVGGPGKDGQKRRRDRKKDKEGADAGAVVTVAAPVGPGAVGLAYTDRDGVVAGSVKALWTGHVADLIKMREDLDSTPSTAGLGSDDRRWLGNIRSNSGFERDWKHREHRSRVPNAVASDGDADDHPISYDNREKRYDGRSTEEESDVFTNPSGGHTHTFRGMWGGRMRGKLGNWAALGRRKHQSVDLATSPPNKGKESDPSPQPPTSSRQPSRLIIGGGMSRRSSSYAHTNTGSRTQSPLLPPIMFSADRERDPDDDDLLSSGQVSPLSDYRPNPFNVLGSSTTLAAAATHDDSGSSKAPPGRSAASMQHLGGGLSAQEYEHTLTRLLNQKRPRANRRLTQNARVSSWADPVSARDRDSEAESGSVRGGQEEDEGGLGHQRQRRSGVDDDPEEELESDVSQLGSGGDTKWKRKEKARFHSLLSVVDGEGVLAEELLGSSGDEEFSDDEGYNIHEMPMMDRRKGVGLDLRRRRSFHDLNTFRAMEVLTPERMKIDVEICGQMLIMYRRAEHLQNVITTIRLLSNALSKTNTTQRSHYQSHLDILSQIDHKSLILASLDVESLKSGKLHQSTNTLRYEAEQFRVDDLWQAASPSRHKVFALREKVFGTGGRRLPAGVHGAHGPFNRLQWTLDGRERLVDYLGRTESEAEEESGLEHLRRGGVRVDRAANEEEDVVAHPGIKPMWLLRFFTSWGARWSATGASTPAVAPPPPEDAGAKATECKPESPMEETQSLPQTAESPRILPSRGASVPIP